MEQKQSITIGRIQLSEVETVARLMSRLPEFQSPYNEEEIRNRIAGVSHLILVAFMVEKPVGFKLGYEREGHFYSWLGGVLPEYRQHGIARMLAAEQERWARDQGYADIIFKTRNRHKAMLLFALKNGFDITGVEEREPVAENRIWLCKKLGMKPRANDEP